VTSGDLQRSDATSVGGIFQGSWEFFRSDCFPELLWLSCSNKIFPSTNEKDRFMAAPHSVQTCRWGMPGRCGTTRRNTSEAAHEAHVRPSSSIQRCVERARMGPQPSPSRNPHLAFPQRTSVDIDARLCEGPSPKTTLLRRDYGAVARVRRIMMTAVVCGASPPAGPA
jgi:hypothetical protein